MAAAIAGFVLSYVGTSITEFVVSHVGTALTYVCCLITNVDDLTDAAKDLEGVQADLQVRVDESNRNGEKILNQVKAWMEKAASAQVNAQDIIVNQNPGIFNLKSRYTISKRAKEIAESINQLRDHCKFDHVAMHEGRPQIPPVPAPSGGIESRKKTEDDIIIAMRERDAYVIGLCGMGGVGKTTMAKQIMNRAKEDEGLFDEVLFVVVGQRADMLKIQRDIADWLGLKFEEETLAPRAIRLRNRLLGGKRKLIVIDDVWERINMEEIGIPCKSDSCTILLTSRDRGVLRQMNARRVFIVLNLSEEEAWYMFQENVGACLEDDPNLLPTARDVAKECKGLPLALVSVSRALKDQASKGIWSDALKQLQSSNPMDIPGFIQDVYNPIRLSFDFLENPHAKSLLFLCSSFPDDHQISLEYLALYGFGLCILGDDINNLEEARNRITWLVAMLKSRFLLLNGEDEHCVKMHDVVRDVAIFIASKEKHAILGFTSLDWSKQNPHINDCNMLSVFRKRQFVFPMGLNFPNLSFLWFYSVGDRMFPMSDNFLEGMQQLKVLSISDVSFGLTPKNMRLLKNLRTLHLYECYLGTLSAVGELSSLEILCCQRCHFITELPVEIGRLHHLRLLDVTDCFDLKTIVPGVISRLGQLEELKVSCGFKGWELEEIENERRNASLAELQSLSKLTCLEIEIEDWSLDKQVLQLSSKILKYNIKVGETLSEWKLPCTNTTHEKKLSVSLQMSTSLRNWIDVFARTAEYLCLEGVDSNGFDFSGNQNMRCLVLQNCQTVVKLVSSSSTDCRLSVFPVLEEMHLGSLPKFEEICDGPIPNGSNSFAKLKEISLSNLDRLRRVFSSSVVIRSISHLRILKIKDCESMEEVFWIEKDDENSPSCIAFPKLETLSLNGLGRLAYFCKGIDIIEFPQLFQLDIKYCPKLTSLGKASNHQTDHVSSSGDHDSIHIFCNTKISFGSLTTLDIKGYKNISYLWCHLIPHRFFAELEWLKVSNISNIINLFSYSIATNLVNLQKLIIDGCDDMAYVIAEDDSIATTSGKIIFPKLHIIFHKLEVLTLNDLPKLKNFCEGRWDIQLPSLKQLTITNVGFYSARECVPLLCNAQITFDKLTELYIRGNLGDRDHIKHLFSYSVAGNFVNLETLEISGFSEMVYVIADDDDFAKTSGNNPQTIFHKLELVELERLPKLQSLCDWGWDVQFPSLKVLSIYECPGMKGVTLESIRKQNIEAVESRRQRVDVD